MDIQKSHWYKTVHALMENSHSRRVLIFIGYFTLIAMHYRLVFKTYFQGDEWHYFSEYLPFLKTQAGVLLTIHSTFFDPISVHFVPLLDILHYYEIKYLGLVFSRYVLLSLTLHTLNTILVLIFVKRLTRSKNISILASLFFALSAAHYHAVSWMGAYLNVELSTLFALGSLLLFDQYLISKQTRLIRWSSILLVAALLIKEGAVFALFVFPLLVFFKKDRAKYRIRNFNPLLLSCLFYFLFRIFGPQVGRLVGYSELFEAQSFVWNGWSIVIFRLIVFPMRGFVQSFVPVDTIMKLAEGLAVLAYPAYGSEASVRGTSFLTFTQGAGSDMVMLALFFILTFVLVYLYKGIRHVSYYSHSVIIAGSILVGSVWPLIFIGFTKVLSWWGYSTFIESRHLYTTSIGISILFALLLDLLGRQGVLLGNNRFGLGRISWYVLSVGLLFTVWLAIQKQSIDSVLTKDVDAARERIMILDAISADYPTLPKKTAFFTESDSAYYGFGAYMLPFQINFGRTLLIYYAYRQDIPYQLVSGDFWTSIGITEEGSDSFRDYRFGYYLSPISLREAVMNETFTVDDVIAYSWDGKNKRILEITSRVRNTLKDYMKRMKEFSTWVPYVVDTDAKFVFKHPADAKIVVDNDMISVYYGSGHRNKIVIRTQKFPVGSNVSEFVSEQKDRGGQIIGKDFTFESIELESGEVVTALLTTSESTPEYYLPLSGWDHIAMVSLYATDAASQKTGMQILKFIRHNK